MGSLTPLSQLNDL